MENWNYCLQLLFTYEKEFLNIAYIGGNMKKSEENMKILRKNFQNLNNM